MFDITFLEKGGRRKRLDFEGDICSIGSDRKNIFVINNRNVLKQHASIHYDAKQGLVLKPAESNALVWLNREKLTSPTIVAE